MARGGCFWSRNDDQQIQPDRREHITGPHTYTRKCNNVERLIERKVCTKLLYTRSEPEGMEKF